MKIAYYIKLYSDYGVVGILKKIVDQVKTWESQGHEVCLFLLARNNANLRSLYANLLKDISIFSVAWDTGFGLICKEWQVVKSLLKYDPDLLYFRLEISLPVFIYYLKKKKVNAIAEINTDLERETRLNSLKMFFYCRVATKILLKNINGLIFVTDELRKKFHQTKFDGYSTTVSNSINLSKYKILPLSGNEYPSVCFMSSANFVWNDFEQITALASFFPKWQFHIIGDIVDGKLIPKLPANIQVHGYMSADEYTKVLKTVDVGIGALALYKKQMNEGSTLKVREYLAMGLPIIIGHTDVDFKEEVPFILRLPNKENNLLDNKNRIEEFANIWMRKRVSRDNVYHLDVEVKEKQRLEFFMKCLTSCDEKK